MPAGSSRFRTLLAVLALAGASPGLAAQGGSADGYLFAKPLVVVSIRGGLDRPLVNAGVFQFFTENLTLSQAKFLAGTWSGEVAVPLTSRFDVVASVGRSFSSAPSEFRRFIDNNDLPIEQTTTLSRLPVALSVRYFLAPRGEAISSLAWIPNRVAPYVGAGIGTMWYKLEQRGDFVDFDTRNVFGDEFTSDGQATMGVAFVGAEFRVSPRVALVGEVRYQSARGALDADFQGFPRANLSGVSLTSGLSFRL